VGAGEGPAQVGVRGPRVRHQQVAAQGVGEHVRVLGDDADEFAQLGLGEVAEVAAAEGYAARGRVPEAKEKVGERALARAARADYGDPLAGFEGEGDVLQDGRGVPFVAEGYVFEAEGAVRGRGEGSRRVRDFWLRVYDLEEALAGVHGAAEELEGLAQGLDGLEAAEHHEREKGQVDAPDLPGGDERNSEGQHRDHCEVHHQVGESIL
jgi:hypothetical protein